MGRAEGEGERAVAGVHGAVGMGDGGETAADGERESGPQGIAGAGGGGERGEGEGEKEREKEEEEEEEEGGGMRKKRYCAGCLPRY